MSIPKARKLPQRVRASDTTLAHLKDGFRVRTESTAAALGGNNALAEYLGVNKSQLTRWASGGNLPTMENARTLADLDYIVTRLRLVWGDGDTIRNWLTGSNAFLDRARPVDVLRLQGAGPVLEAIELEIAGAYA